MTAPGVSALRGTLAALFGALLLILGSAALWPTQMEVRAQGPTFDGMGDFGTRVVDTFEQLRGNRIRSGTLCADAEGLKHIRTSIDTQRVQGNRTGVTKIRKDGNTNDQNYHLTTKLISCMISPIPGDGAPGTPGKPGYVIYYGKLLVNSISKLFISVLSAMALLAVVLYGIRTVLGFTHELQSAGLLLIFKIGLLFFALGTLPTLYEAAINTMNGMSGRIAAAIPTDMCPEIDDAKAEFMFGGEDRMFMLPWVKLDCSVESIATVLLDDRNSAFGTMITAFVSGNIGKGLAVSFFATAYTLFNALNLAVFIVVLANLALVLMFMVAPMAWVCALFKPTMKYFHNWLKITTGFVLQPIILALFLMMMISAFEQVMCKQPFSVVASFNAIKNGHTYTQYINKDPVIMSKAEPGTDYGPAWCTRQKMQEAMYKEMISPQAFQAFKNTVMIGSTDFDFIGKLSDGAKEGVFGGLKALAQEQVLGIGEKESFDIGQIDMPQINPKLVAQLGLPFLSMLAAFTVMFVLYAFLQQIPNFINQLASSAVASGNLNQIRMPGKGKEAMNALNEATGGFNTGGMAAFGNMRRGLAGVRNSGNKSGGE